MATLHYELILMLDPQAADEQRSKVATEAKSKLESQGELVHEANWGLRKMAYEIDRRGEADYRFYRFAGGKELLDDLDHSLKIAEGVLRFRIFKSERDAPLTVPPDTEQIMRREEDDRERGGRGGPRRGRSDSGDRGDRGDRGGERRDRPAAAPPPEPAAAPAAAAETPPPAAPEAPAAPAPDAPAAPASDAPAAPAPDAPETAS